MKILLVYPPITVYDPDPTIPSAQPVLGLAYLGSYLEALHHEVRIMDALALGINNVQRVEGGTRYGLSEEDILTIIWEFDPDLVGVTCMFSSYSTDAHRLAAIVKDYNHAAPVIFGGAHSSICPEWVLKDENVDIVVFGEGEITMSELVSKLQRGEGISEVRGIAFRQDGRIVKNKPREFMTDIDSIPLPARHLLPMGIYLNNSKSPYNIRFPATTVVTSRGCPGNCVFCSIHSVWGHRWRYRDPKSVVDEIEHLIKQYNVREIEFLDDNIAASNKRLEAICDEIIRRKLNIKWATPNGIAYWTLDEKLLRKMKKSGCYRLTFGIESGNIATRKFIGKTHSLESAKKIIGHANKIGLWTVCTFIIGFPYEKKDSIMDTVRFAVESGTDFAVFYLLGVFPGTKVYEIFKKEGLLDFDRVFNDPASATVTDFSVIGQSLASRGTKTKYFTQSELQACLDEAYRVFALSRIKHFLNPSRLLRKVYSPEDLKYAIRLSTAMSIPLYRMMLRKFSTHFALHKKANLNQNIR
ncbi:hypothetical protein A3K80_04325, partial [Candidatus Bathyarchaeota archaeon RBG_13_38_9]